MSAAKQVTALLVEVRAGNRRAAGELIELVYPELRRVARQYMNRERAGHTLQPTALVHEAYIRMFGHEPLACNDRSHFFALAAREMRNILVDHARKARAEKRGGEAVKIGMDTALGLSAGAPPDFAELDEALERLAALDAKTSRVVELRFFGGLTEEETATVLATSVSSVRRDWAFARAWLFGQLKSK